MTMKDCIHKLYLVHKTFFPIDGYICRRGNENNRLFEYISMQLVDKLIFQFK